MFSLQESELAKPVPLKEDAGGVIRVQGTRVTLDTLVTAFNEGATAEEIVQQYPNLELADVYAVIGYYLRQREELDDYLKRSRARASEIRRENEKRYSPKGVRERLLARRAAKG